MDETYQGHGIRFRYPAFWQLAEQDDGESKSITVASPNTSFWSISLFPEGTSPEQVIASAVEAFREEYDELDVYPSEAMLGDHLGAALDVDFVCLELINSAFLRSFQTDQLTVLVLYQGFDGELVETRPLLEAISASLVLEGDDD
jgi:hypothetical protein